MPLNLSHLQPCDQPWDGMSPTEQGRLCAKCNKQILDFRSRSGLEIGRIHAASDQPVCGLYSAAQLGQPGADSLPRMHRLVSLVAGLSLIAGSSAAAQALPPPTEQVPAPDRQVQHQGAVAQDMLRAIPAPADTLIVQGSVRDSASGRPLPGAAIVVQGTQVGTLTNELGEYVLRLPRRPETPETLVIRAALIGYSRIEQAIHTREGIVRLDFVLPQAQVELTAFYVTGVAAKPSLWQRVRRLFGRDR